MDKHTELAVSPPFHSGIPLLLCLIRSSFIASALIVYQFLQIDSLYKTIDSSRYVFSL